MERVLFDSVLEAGEELSRADARSSGHSERSVAKCVARLLVVKAAVFDRH